MTYLVSGVNNLVEEKCVLPASGSILFGKMVLLGQLVEAEAEGSHILAKPGQLSQILC